MSGNAGRDWRLYADDIVEACGKIRRFIAGMDFDAPPGRFARRELVPI